MLNIFQTLQNVQPKLLKPVIHAEPVSPKWKGKTDKVATIILAGGQGSRLHASLPKALIPLVENKTLLELQLEKVRDNPCALITSPENHDLIATFLQKSRFRPALITQTEVPFLTDEGTEFSAGPDGNGHALHLAKACGLLDNWKQAGIETITVVPIDNILANPLDPFWIGYHIAQGADVTPIAIERKNPEEKVGLFVYDGDKIVVREYSEFAEGQTGTLANTGLFAFSLPFAERIVTHEIPWHIARKQDPISGRWMWKFERFLFDVLPFSSKTTLLLYPRETIYAPIKEPADLALAQEALKNSQQNPYSPKT